MDKSVVLNFLDSFHFSEPVKSAVSLRSPFCTDHRNMKTAKSHLSNVSLRLSSVTVAVRFLQYNTFTRAMVSSSGSSCGSAQSTMMSQLHTLILPVPSRLRKQQSVGAVWGFAAGYHIRAINDQSMTNQKQKRPCADQTNLYTNPTSWRDWRPCVTRTRGNRSLGFSSCRRGRSR